MNSALTSGHYRPIGAIQALKAAGRSMDSVVVAGIDAQIVIAAEIDVVVGRIIIVVDIVVAVVMVFVTR